MPSRNIIRMYSPDSYYHIYARGASKQKIFHDASDYRYFSALFTRYLSKAQQRSKEGIPYPHYFGRIELIAYCLMTNHFHLLIHQNDSNDIQGFMKSLMTSYSRYFNLKYKRTGSLFESRYKASKIENNTYLLHVSRYIHLNPRYWENYYNSSFKYYKNGNEPEWLFAELILGMFDSRDQYMVFTRDYEEMRDMLADIKYQLADQ